MKEQSGEKEKRASGRRRRVYLVSLTSFRRNLTSVIEGIQRGDVYFVALRSRIIGVMVGVEDAEPLLKRWSSTLAELGYYFEDEDNYGRKNIENLDFIDLQEIMLVRKK